MIYPTLNNKIQTILEGVSRIKAIYAYPAQDFTSYPAVVYYPSSISNEFENTRDNFKIYGYKVWVIIGTNGTSVQNVFENVMPEVVDAVLSAFDDGWDFDTIEGHRCWQKVETGAWSVIETQSGVEISAEIDLSIKILTT